MNVLFVVLEDFPGGDTRVRRQVSALRNSGHSVGVLCARGYSKENEWEGCRITRSWTSREKGAGMARRFSEYMLFFMEAIVRVTIIGLQKKIDIVQIANMPDFLALAAVPLRLFRGCPIVLDLHDLMPELMVSKAEDAKALKRLLLYQERLGVRTADAVLTVNDICAEILRHRYPELSVVTIPNSPDERTFPKCSPRIRDLSGPVRIGYHGTVAKRFGVATLISAFHLLRMQGVDATLDIWGGGVDLEAVKRSANDLGVQGAVRFHGQTRVERLVQMLKSIDISVVPYEADPYMAIAYSTKAFELAAMGVPMVVSNLPGIREQFSDKAVAYFTPGSVHDMANAILRLVLNPEEALDLAKAAQIELDQFAWPHHAATYVKKLEQLSRTGVQSAAV